MTQDDMKRRTKTLGLRVIRLSAALPSTGPSGVISKQLLRCGTSVGANYRAACRARSKAEFLAKLGIVEEEADESLYWLDLLVEAGLIPEPRVAELIQEFNEVLSMVVAMIRSTRKRK